MGVETGPNGLETADFSADPVQDGSSGSGNLVSAAQLDSAESAPRLDWVQGLQSVRATTGTWAEGTPMPVCELNNSTVASITRRRSVEEAYDLMQIHRLLHHQHFVASHSIRLRPLGRSAKRAGRSIVRSVMTSLLAAVMPTLPQSEPPSLAETNTLLGNNGELPLSAMPELSPMP